MSPTFFPIQTDFREWLQVNAAKETELVVEEIVVDESTLEIIAETPAPITPKKKNER